MIRWGVAGPGAIAHGFADAMRSVADGTIVAVASRSMERANSYGEQFAVPSRYGDYDSMAADPDVDAVYVATPHSRHEEDTIGFLAAGKHVLCEKPLALNAQQARRMVDASRRHNVFLMEAIWSRFLPAYRSLVEVLGDDRIGKPLLVSADLGFRRPFDPEHRLFNRALGGGALLDLGIYPLQLCSLVLGEPDGVVAQGVLGDSGVDEQVVATLRYPGAALSVIKAALRVNLACTARISGTDGHIDVPAWMHCPNSITVTPSGSKAESIDCTYEGNGLRFEIEEVHRCLEGGRLESSVIPLDESVLLASTLDVIRSQIGVVYPGD